MKKLGLLIMPLMAVSLLASCEEGNSPSYHTVSFYSNGGSPVEAQRIENGKTATKPDPAPTKDGYNEPTWEDESGEEFDFSTRITSDITLYADWGDPITYTITYKNLYDAGNINFTTYNIESSFVLENPIYDDYAFDFKGWYILKDEVPTQISEIKKGTMGDLTIYAVWNDDKQYNITYKNLGVATTDNPTKYNPVTTDSFTLNEPSDGGYKFTGWHLGSPEGELIEEFYPLFFAEEIKIYASWDKNPINYNITYENLLGAKTDNKTSYTVETDTFTLNNPTTDNGYTFTGWHLGSLEGEVITQIEKGMVGHLHIYASWGNPITYTITYDLDGGTISGDNPSTYNVTQKIELKSPTIDGFIFSGWCLDEGKAQKLDGSGWNSGDRIGNINLYADYRTDKTLEEYSWTEIAEIANKERPDRYLDIGDTKTVSVDGFGDYQVRIIDFKYDDLSSGSGKAGITFEFADLINASAFWNDDGINYNFPNSTLNNFLNNNDDCIFNKLPTELKGMIKEVNKKVEIHPNDAWVEGSYSTHLFPLSHDEIDGNDNNTYDYYKVVSGRCIRGIEYFLRSPATHTSNCAWYVRFDGLISIKNVCNEPTPFSTAFCI